MRPDELLHEHGLTSRVTWRVLGGEVDLATKVGVPGAPGLDRGVLALGEARTRGRAAPRAGAAPERTVDATGGVGAVAALLRARGGGARVLVTSAAARRAALASGTPPDQLDARFPWELPARSVDEAWWRPATDRGRERLDAELVGWSRALDPGGRAWVAWHKDEGAKRAEARAAQLFGRVEVVERTGGWRVCALAEPHPDVPEPDPWRAWDGPDAPMRSLVGTFAAGRLDEGSAALLAALASPDAPTLAGARVLDLGCGSGVLAVHAAAAGASHVLALDDDLAAVRSAEASLAPWPQIARVGWSDLTLDVPDARGADLVVMNPPFHVGRQVVGALSRAFVAAAVRAVRAGGALVLVANAALPYERELEGWARWQAITPAGVRRFKVLVARPR